MKLNKIYNMDCRKGFRQMKQDGNKISCLVTSPPYWNLRKYAIEQEQVWDEDPICDHDFEIVSRKDPMDRNGSGQFNEGGIGGNKDVFDYEPFESGFCTKCGAWKGQLGLEPNPDLYVKHLCDIFDLVRDVLRDDGTLWVNIGDTYSTGAAMGMNERIQKEKENEDSKYVSESFEKPKIDIDMPKKSLCLVPQRFALEMIQRRWILRNVIIWHKPNGMPQSVKDRFTINFEYIYFFVKNEDYFFNQQFEQSKSDPWKEKNRRALWTINTKPHKEAHFAVFPETLIEIPIDAGTPEYICNECKKPLEKVTKEIFIDKSGEYTGEGIKEYEKNKVQNPSDVKRRILKSMETKEVFKGWDWCCSEELEDYTPGVVCDPFAGIGTTCKQAMHMDRQFIGFEISEKYFAIAEKNMKLEKKYKKETSQNQGDFLSI